MGHLAVTLLAIIFALVADVLGQFNQQRKTWPMYSLQNMPQTAFSCHDKILGGYYADSETQCQMFHVCVKVAGVGVQDFRFLCPNGTAFDQEAQTCADWGDIDCEQSILYYGSDNFDLYRLGSGFESKRAPLAEEEEATFHLQRAESTDVRRSKPSRIVDQQSRPDQPPNYTKHYEREAAAGVAAAAGAGVTTSRNQFNQNSNFKRTQFNDHQNRGDEVNRVTPNFEVTKRPTVANYYTPTRPTTTTTTTSTSTERNAFDKNIESRNYDSDDLFKGSHSSHFFSNRNGGREDDYFENSSPKARPNDFGEFYKISESSGNKNRIPLRGRRLKPQSQSNVKTDSADVAVATSTTQQSKITKKLTLQTSFNAAAGHFDQQFRSTTQPTIPTKTTTANTHRSADLSHRYDFQTQQKIEPTTFNPLSGVFRYKTATKTHLDRNDDGNAVKGINNNNNFFSPHQADSYNSRVANKPQKFDRPPFKVGQEPKESSNGNRNEFNDFAKTSAPSGFQLQKNRNGLSPRKLQQQGLLEPLQKLIKNQTESIELLPQRNRSSSKQKSFIDIEPQYYRSRQVSEPFRDPAPFSASKTTTTTTLADLNPRGFINRGNINYKSTTTTTTTQAAASLRNDNFTPSTGNLKKFSTLVPKDQYSPTTFKPTTFNKKSYENTFFQTQAPKFVSFNSQNNRVSPTTTTTTSLPVTVDPYYSPDEDDGQYHPELYEIDYSQRPSVSPTTTINPSVPSLPTSANQWNFYQRKSQHQQPSIRSDLSGEDELFNAAHSLNLGAASVNKLRADKLKAEKTHLQQLSSPTAVAFTSKGGIPTLVPSAVTTTTTARPSSTTTTTTTTVRTPFYNQPSIASQPVSKKPVKPVKSGIGGDKSSKKFSKNSKRPAHADQDTSYDYAYYDSLNGTPQEYQDYEVIEEFSKTRRN